MVHKHKNHTKIIENRVSRLETAVSRIGMAVVAAATILSIAELSDREGHRAAAVLQPAYAFAADPSSGNDQNTNSIADDLVMRRTKEEVAHTAASYGQVRRSNSISGTL